MKTETTDLLGFDAVPVLNAPENLQEIMDMAGPERVYQLAWDNYLYHVHSRDVREAVVNAISTASGMEREHTVKGEKKSYTEKPQDYINRLLSTRYLSGKSLKDADEDELEVAETEMKQEFGKLVDETAEKVVIDFTKKARGAGGSIKVAQMYINDINTKVIEPGKTLAFCKKYKLDITKVVGSDDEVTAEGILVMARAYKTAVLAKQREAQKKIQEEAQAEL